MKLDDMKKAVRAAVDGSASHGGAAGGHMTQFIERTESLTDELARLGIPVAITVIESDDPADAPADEGWTLSIPVRTTCTDCAAPLTDKELVATVRAIGRTVRSEWSRQHGCGAWPELVQRDVWADDVTDEEVIEKARQLVAERNERAAEIDKRRRARLTRELAEFLAADEDERDSIGRHGIDLSGAQPGFYRDGDEWTNWDYSVLDPTEIIVVRQENVGLRVSHGCFEGGYGGFARFREAVAAAAKEHYGYEPNYEEHQLLRTYQGWWDDEHPWSHPLDVLFIHSDCDGWIFPHDAKELADALEPLIDYLPKDKYASFTNRAALRGFVEGLRKAADKWEVVTFR